MGKRIEEKTSITAQMTCLMRALSYNEKKESYKSDDYIAPLLMPSFLRGLVKFSFFRYIYKHLAPRGIYEYIIARTKYIDEVFQRNLKNVEQVLIFGAGFDSRSIRFKDKLKHTNYFELDSAITQIAKVKRLSEKRIQVPSNAVYIPIDFNKESIAQKLNEYCFNGEKACLFLLEGLTMYLNAESIDATFKLIFEYAGIGSIIVFDYVYLSVLRQENTYKGEKKVRSLVRIFSEKWNFGIEKGQISNFLMQYGFALSDESNSRILEKRYFMNQNGKIIGHVNGTHSLVTAIKG